MKDIYEFPEPPEINYQCCSLWFNAFNMEEQKHEIKMFSFLEIAQMICPNGKGKILTHISYPYYDDETGPGEQVKEIEITPSEFLQELYSEEDFHYQMLEDTKEAYREELIRCIIDKLNRIYIEKHNSITC